MRKQSMVIVLAGVLLVSTSTLAFWPFSKKKTDAAKEDVRRRYHLLVPDKTAERQLLELFAKKRLIMQQIQVLEQLKEEKRRELQEFNRKLLREFSMEPSGRYEFDPADQTIYVLSGDERKLHLRITNDQQLLRFSGLYTGQRLVADEIRVFQLVQQEKASETAELDRQLEDQFSIQSDRNYQYEFKTMRLYEVVEPETKAEPVDVESLFQVPVPMW